MSDAPIHTVGHGTLAAEDFVALLRAAGIAEIVDVRSFPGSRRNPQFGKEAMATWLPEAGIDYRWEPRLGGRRRKVTENSRHAAWRHEAFRSYADWMETDEFRAGLAELLASRRADGAGTAVMCSESVWWRCHRRLISDHLVLVEGVPVLHLMHDGRLTPHPPLAEARVEEGDVVYDG